MHARSFMGCLAAVLLVAGGEAADADVCTPPSPNAIAIDLAHDEPTTERELPRGTYDVVVMYRVPREDYRVSATRSPEVLSPPTIPDGTPSTTPTPDRCASAIQAERAKVAAATGEEEVSRLIRDALAAAPSGCESRMKKALCEQTTIEMKNLAKVEHGSVTTVKVRRVRDDRTWEQFVRTGPPARWAVLPLTGAIWTEGEEYFAEPVEVTDDEGNTSGKFRLVQEDDDELAPMAGIAVLLLRETKWRWPWPDAHGPFVGIGFTTTDPPVGLTFGYGLSWRDHVALTVGGALVQERHLLGRYQDDLRDGTLLDTNLTNEQLTEPEAEFRCLAGLAISFGGGGE